MGLNKKGCRLSSCIFGRYAMYPDKIYSFQVQLEVGQHQLEVEMGQGHCCQPSWEVPHPYF